MKSVSTSPSPRLSARNARSGCRRGAGLNQRQESAAIHPPCAAEAPSRPPKRHKTPKPAVCAARGDGGPRRRARRQLGAGGRREGSKPRAGSPADSGDTRGARHGPIPPRRSGLRGRRRLSGLPRPVPHGFPLGGTHVPTPGTVPVQGREGLRQLCRLGAASSMAPPPLPRRGRCCPGRGTRGAGGRHDRRSPTAAERRAPVPGWGAGRGGPRARSAPLRSAVARGGRPGLSSSARSGH